MSGLYGSKFADLWRGCDLDSVKRKWVKELSGYSRDEIQRGLDACLRRVFAPNLPEFLMLCRPALDPEAAFHEAIKQLAARESGTDVWTHPAIYWAAVAIGQFDLRNASWPAIKARWTAALQSELDKREWPEIPKRLDALPAPDAISIDREDTIRRIDEIKRVLKQKVIGKENELQRLQA